MLSLSQCGRGQEALWCIFNKDIKYILWGLRTYASPKSPDWIILSFQDILPEFPGGLVVKTFSFHSSTPENVGSDPW